MITTCLNMHAVYSCASAGDQATMVSKVAPLLKQYGVQAYLSGHKHNLEVRAGSQIIRLGRII